MSYFKVIVNSTTADPYDLNENFYDIMIGDRLPLTKTADGILTPADKAGDLGSSVYYWRNLHCKNVFTNDIDSSGQLYFKLSETILSAATSSIEITGLDGNSETEYLLYVYGVGPINTITNIFCHINSDSSSSYNYTYLQGNAATLSYVGNVTTTGFYVSIAVGSSVESIGYGVTKIFAKTGKFRQVISNVAGSLSNTVSYIYKLTTTYWNTSTNITSLKFVDTYSNQMQPGTHILLYGIK